MEEIAYCDSRKDLPINELHKIFVLVGWSDGSETLQMLNNYNVPFINSTLVISAWKNKKLIGFVRVLSDKMFRSIIYDLAVHPEYQHYGIGSAMIQKCIEHFPNSEWLVETVDGIEGFYEKQSFKVIAKNGIVYLKIACKLFTKE
ncbi:MAG: GNAT family N-acetyltransferase [Spirochaetaceae bacterium]|jgi:ribosomal protein S18 acetylase RimI-like enzyme|nr:GNAT family N-acetyltransferase [Spirochaetaceae bacterium]